VLLANVSNNGNCQFLHSNEDRILVPLLRLTAIFTDKRKGKSIQILRENQFLSWKRINRISQRKTAEQVAVNHECDISNNSATIPWKLREWLCESEWVCVWERERERKKERERERERETQVSENHNRNSQKFAAAKERITADNNTADNNNTTSTSTSNGWSCCFPFCVKNLEILPPNCVLSTSGLLVFELQELEVKLEVELDSGLEEEKDGSISWKEKQKYKRVMWETCWERKRKKKDLILFLRERIFRLKKDLLLVRSYQYSVW